MFISIFLAAMAFIPILLWFLPYAISLGAPFGPAGQVGAFLFPLFLLHVVLSVIFALRDLSSSDQFKMLAKLMLIVDIGLPLTFSVFTALNFYVFDRLGWTVGTGFLTSRLLAFYVVFEVLGILVFVKKIFGDKIRKWYHLTPLSGIATITQAQKYLADAEKRLKRGQFEGASEGFHSVAQVYVSLGDWTNAAKYYWSAAETLSKDSPSLGFGVALHYALSAAAYLLSNNLEKVNEAMMLANGISNKPKINSRGEISFTLDVLDRIRNKNVQQLLEDWPRLARKVREKLGPYGEEMVMLLERNLGLAKG